ncbi:molecular chaperone DnaJ [Fructilactobacillus carniphilus]|uniref:Chaperone protein DnaJ n=1 Tax=Fructilactobacillus carniphilus TaxID=2940297 RepID=A0ABY5BWZ5_9LACO|nr:molecular chaperone DnaJ [Fructilactobacillus carniphilus]USS91012.1 molecular chaperone DnaJ [Fructilactobacillus carniphilus]
MAAKDYYDVLGVSKDASEKDINHAYRHLSKKYHPDINKEPGAEEKFKEITEAYEVLSDKQKRANYDQYGSADGPQGFGGGAGGGGGFGGAGGAGFGDFSDIFSDLFGGGGRRQTDPTAPQQGEDLQYQMTLTFDEAIFGKTTKINYRREAQCPDCHGTGAKPGTHPETCPDCHGTGRIARTVNTPMGQMQTQSACPRCDGTGKIIKEKCQKCGGAGKISEDHEVEVKVPAGVEEGQQMRLQGQGNAGINGGPYGDLFVVFRVLPSKDFQRDGSTIYYNKDISFTDAALGNEIDVKTVYGNGKLTIPAGTQTGTVFKLKGKGAPRLHSDSKGDEMVRVTVVTPKKLSPEQKLALKAFAEASGENPIPEKGFFEKLKDKLK